MVFHLLATRLSSVISISYLGSLSLSRSLSLSLSPRPCSAMADSNTSLSLSLSLSLWLSDDIENPSALGSPIIA